MRRVLAAVGVGVVTAAVIAGAGLRGVSAQDDASKPAFYKEKVRPILETNCGKCHMSMDHKGGLSLQTKASTLKGGRDGVVIVPGDPASSLLVKLIRHEGPADDPEADAADESEDERRGHRGDYTGGEGGRSEAGRSGPVVACETKRPTFRGSAANGGPLIVWSEWGRAGGIQADAGRGL